MKELDLKLTLGMAERRLTESPPDEESCGGGQWPDEIKKEKKMKNRKNAHALLYVYSN